MTNINQMKNLNLIDEFRNIFTQDEFNIIHDSVIYNFHNNYEFSLLYSKDLFIDNSLRYIDRTEKNIYYTFLPLINKYCLDTRKHFNYMVIQGVLYRYRDEDPSYISKTLEVCELDFQLFNDNILIRDEYGHV